MSREQLLTDASAAFCEFVEVAIHTLLYMRGVYPAEIFERRRKYNVPVKQSRHKELNNYIAGAVKGAHHWMTKGLLEKVVLCIEDKESGKKLERFVWEIDFDMTRPNNRLAGPCSRVHTQPNSQEEFEDALKQVLLKISVVDSLIPPQTRKDTLEDEPGWRAQQVAARDGGSLVPLKSVQAGPMHLQLYAEI